MPPALDVIVALPRPHRPRTGARGHACVRSSARTARRTTHSRTSPCSSSSTGGSAPASSIPGVTYTYDPELQVVIEDRPGMQSAYTARGTIAYATATAEGVEPLALALALPVPPGAEST